MRVYRLIAAVLFWFLCTACENVPNDAYRLPESSLSDREMQTRIFEVAEESDILGASVALLQDMEYNVDTLEPPLGILTASKTVDADSDFEKAGLIAAEIGLIALSVLSGTAPTGGVYADADDRVFLDLTLVVLPSLAREGSYSARITLQETLYNKAGMIKSRGVIDDAEVYQEIFDKLRQSIYLDEAEL